MSRRTSGPPSDLGDVDFCNECNGDQESGAVQTQRELRRQRRRRGRSEPTCFECPTTQTRSSSSGRERSSRGHRRSSSSTDEAVTSSPDPNPSTSADHRRSSSVSCSRHNRTSSSRTRRRRARPNGRRRRSSATGNPASPPPTCLAPEPECSGAVSNPESLNQNDSGNHSPQREAQLCQIRQWPHGLCFMFACLTCTLSMFGISRFAILTIDYGAIFLVQFLLLSLIFGIPMLTFFSSVGQYLGSGVIDMWRISPVFQGIGVSLMLAQGLYGIYNIAAISWLFIYFRDSFISSGDRYRWTMCFDGIKYGRNCDLNSTFVNSSSYNSYHQWKLEETIPDYFSGVVLMRSAPTYPHSFTALRFQTLFNMVVIWMPVFIALSKGLKSYGRVVFVLGGFPILSFLVFSTKIIGLMPMSHFQEWFVNTQWMEFLYNGQSWVCAARECFFTWGILGASILQLSSHNTFKHKLIRDTTTVVIVTLAILLLAGFLGVAVSLLIIRTSGYEYTASSFETAEGYEFLRMKPLGPRLMREGRDYPATRDHDEFFNDKAIHESDPFYNTALLDSFDLSTTTESTFKQRGSNRFSPVVQYVRSPVRVSRLPSIPRYDREHVSFLAGIRIIQTGRSTDKYSGYQVMRLATELMPTYAAILGPKILSPFWVVLFYLTMIVMGLAQQMALVHTVASGLIAIRPDHFMQFESSLTFMSCLLGLVLCFPLATEFDVFIVYFFDYTIGCGWWLMLLYSALIFAIFIVRGKPYSAENVAMLLLDPERLISASRTGMNKFCCHGASWVVPILAFTWNVILPVGMVILCIVSFKSCYFAEMFDWTTNTGYLYLPSWVREIGAMLQLLPLVLVPFVGIIQTCRYFLNGSDELYEKINLLYRPNFASQINRQSSNGAPGRGGPHGRQGRHNGVVLTNYNQRSPGSDGSRIHNDPPPKYTPPPSYSTATGARIARFLRQSFRQSIRRFRGETWRHSSSTADLVEENLNLHSLGPMNLAGNLDKQEGPPPDYATVIIETSRHSLHPTESERSYGSFSPITIPTISSCVSSSDLSELQPQENGHWRDHDFHVQSSEPVTTTTLSSQHNPRFPSSSINRSLNQTVEDTSLHYAQIQPWNFRFSPNSQDHIGTDRGMAFSKNQSSESDYVSVGQVTVLLDDAASNQISPAPVTSGKGLATSWDSIEETHRGLNIDNDPGFGDGIHGVDYMSVANVTIMKRNGKLENDDPMSLKGKRQASEGDACAAPFNRSLTASPSPKGDISVVIHSDNIDNSVGDTIYSSLSPSSYKETVIYPDSDSNESLKRTRQSIAVSPHRRFVNLPIGSAPLTVSKMGIDLNESSTDDVFPDSSEVLNNLDSNFAQGSTGQLPDEQLLNRVYPRQLVFNIPPTDIVNEPQSVVTIQVDTSSSVI